MSGKRNGNIDKLKELTEELTNGGSSSFPLPILSRNGYSEYKMDKGMSFAWHIHRSGNDIAIHRWFSEKGVIFPTHSHKEKEWIIIYSGSMELQKEGKTQVFVKGDYIRNNPYIEHGAYFPEDCKYITIMMPPSKEYPDGV
jgi:quercetin dioxygenase-like cupin family protein